METKQIPHGCDAKSGDDPKTSRSTGRNRRASCHVGHLRNERTGSVHVNGGNEYMRGRSLEASSLVCFTIRFRSDLTTVMRIVFDSINYGIVSIDAVEGGRRYLEITAKTVHV